MSSHTCINFPQVLIQLYRVTLQKSQQDTLVFFQLLGVRLLYICSCFTGLDPAGPCFECQPSVRVGLHAECARLVEVIHTDGDGTLEEFGTKRPLGHVDFYPNGLGNQPGK